MPNDPLIEEYVAPLVEKIVMLSSFGQGLHPNDIKPDIRTSLKEYGDKRVEEYRDEMEYLGIITQKQ